MTEKKAVGGHNKKTLTEDQAAQLEALAAFLSQDMIADYFGMSRPTLSAIMEREPDLLLRYKRGKAAVTAKVAQSLVQDAIEGDKTSQIFFLKTQAGWRETTKVEGGGENGEHELVFRWQK